MSTSHLWRGLVTGDGVSTSHPWRGLVISWVHCFEVWGSGLGWRSNSESHSVLEIKSGRSDRGQAQCLTIGHPHVYGEVEESGYKSEVRQEGTGC